MLEVTGQVRIRVIPNISLPTPLPPAGRSPHPRKLSHATAFSRHADAAAASLPVARWVVPAPRAPPAHSPASAAAPSPVLASARFLLVSLLVRMIVRRAAAALPGPLRPLVPRLTPWPLPRAPFAALASLSHIPPQLHGQRLPGLLFAREGDRPPPATPRSAGQVLLCL